jgi:putative phosphoesterase
MTPTEPKHGDAVDTAMKLLILSDIHSNWAALHSVLEAESDSDKILCLGDLIDYGPEPAACVAWAMEERNKSLFIQGNHDWGVAFKHASPSDPLFRYLRTREKDLEDEITVAGSPDFLFFGHTHWPLLRRIGSTTIVNPGSVGQPKDGDPRAPYAVWKDGEVELRRVAYPIDATAAAYDRTPLASWDVESLLTVLRTGGTLPSTGVAELALQ